MKVECDCGGFYNDSKDLAYENHCKSKIHRENITINYYIDCYCGGVYKENKELSYNNHIKTKRHINAEKFYIDLLKEHIIKNPIYKPPIGKV